ncbi:Universal stress protein family protein [Epibacterium ulvae]|uniref:Universal stress protein family protein n=1 Tax=Epibacterium ulvae TaxID=1156985 RepID=A0A1G5QK20_9RHOB|nr:universal stress protein [Epibacterium ulvae]SCZ62164.1 Universal stress protein family protein [Epibacterium ulvae]
MAIKNILVAFNGTQSSEAAVSAAVLMHKKYNCHVTGILVHSGQREQLSANSWVPENVRETITAKVKEMEETVHDQFIAFAGNDIAADQVHWISLFGNADATVASYARMYDLTVVGRYDAIHGQEHLELHPEAIALKSGRPVLVVPRGHHPGQIRETAVVAWDGRRAAARAVMDAMQLLETKQKVSVVSVSDGTLRDALEGIDIKTALTRHGIDVARVKKPQSKQKTAQDILQHCEDVSAGLLVMGAYEHSPFRERIFGCNTHYILKNAQLPVLIAH